MHPLILVVLAVPSARGDTAGCPADSILLPEGSYLGENLVCYAPIEQACGGSGCDDWDAFVASDVGAALWDCGGADEGKHVSVWEFDHFTFVAQYDSDGSPTSWASFALENDGGGGYCCGGEVADHAIWGEPFSSCPAARVHDVGQGQQLDCNDSAKMGVGPTGGCQAVPLEMTAMGFLLVVGALWRRRW